MLNLCKLILSWFFVIDLDFEASCKLDFAGSKRGNDCFPHVVCTFSLYWSQMHRVLSTSALQELGLKVCSMMSIYLQPTFFYFTFILKKGLIVLSRLALNSLCSLSRP